MGTLELGAGRRLELRARRLQQSVTVSWAPGSNPQGRLMGKASGKEHELHWA